MALSMKICQNIVLLLYFLNHGVSTERHFSAEDMDLYRQKVVRMFEHAYNGYLEYAYPFDELRPLTCDGQDTWGSYSLTLIDALDTLAIMGNYTEFNRVAEHLINTIDFNKDINVSVFETNIRVVGGLISAHLLSMKAGMELEPGWPCSGPLLSMAEQVARKLLPAFQTPTGLPYGTVNLLHGVPKGETTVVCTAGAGTFLVEFGALTRLTGDPIFEKTAKKAMDFLWQSRSSIGLVGNHIDVSTGKWTATDSGIGAGVDSYFEYMVKAGILFQDTKHMEQFHAYTKSIETYLKREDWYMWANMKKGTVTLPVFQSLEAFWPGIQSLVGDVEKGMKTIHNYHQVWKQFGFTPEFYNIPKGEAQTGREGYPLRPELIESTMYLYRATQDPYLLEIGADIVESIESNCKTRCGYATVKDVRNHKLDNRMESFFLSETAKYLYLLFTPDHFIHNTGGHGTLIKTTNGECVIDAGGYVFNTEAHPVDAAALYCCSAEKKLHDQQMADFHDNIDLLALLDLVDPDYDMFSESTKKSKSKVEKAPPSDDVYYNEEEHMCHSESEKETSEKSDSQSSSDTDSEAKSVEVEKNKKSTSVDVATVIDALKRTASQTAELDKIIENLKANFGSPGETVESGDKNTELNENSNSDNSSQNNERIENVMDSNEEESDVCDMDEEDDILQNSDLVTPSTQQSYKHQLLTCPMLPFHFKISVRGQMFVNDEL